MKQSIFTVVTDIEPDALDALRGTIAVIHDHPGDNAILPLAQFDTLHFASLVLAESPSLASPKLIFEGNVDGTVEAWLAALAIRAGAGVDTLFGGCTGYPGSADAETRRAWLTSHVVRPGAFHIGATGRSVDRIRKEAELRRAIEGFLDAQDQAGRLGGASPESVRAEIQAFVEADPELAWAQAHPGERQSKWEHRMYLARAALVGLVALVALPLLLPLLLVAVPILLVKEKIDPVQTRAAPATYVDEVQEDEDIVGVAQNHLSSVIPVKPGILRASLLPVVLYALNLVARINGTHGELGGIPSIHFAHWSLIDRGRHLMFLSNYDGSWESYLGDFIDKAAKGLTAVWSNTAKFPRTTLLAFKGAADGPRFRQWARASQCRTDAWYSAYPSASMSIIDTNSTIRENLFAKLDAAQAVAWLRSL